MSKISPKIKREKYPRTRIMLGLLISTSILGGMTLVSSPIFKNAYVFAATSSQTLNPGQTINNQVVYNTADIENGNAWTVAGTATIPAANQPFSTTLISSTKSSAGLALFNGTLDMSQPVSFQGTFTITVAGNPAALYTGNAMDAGDSLGFILTPASNAQITSNLANSTGQNLGVGGLANSVFLGRDLYYNSSIDSNVKGATVNAVTGGQNVICIRQTDATGTLASATNTGADQQYTATTATDAGITTGTYGANTITETMAFSWTPTATNPNGTSTGILTYNLTALTGANAGQTAQLSTTVTLNNSLSLGVVGATGGNFGIMTFQNDGSNFTASKATEPITVNYIDQSTGQPIASAAASTITATAGDQITINAPTDATTQTGNSYSYNAPTITGYDYVSADPTLTVADGNSATNVINVYYTKHQPINTIKTVTIDKDDTGSILTDTTGYVKLSSNTSSSAPVIINANGDTTTTVTTTNIWHKPIMNTINITVDKDEAGNSLTDLTGYFLISTSASVTTSSTASNGDITITNTTTRIWHKIQTTTVNQVKNVDDTGSSLSDTTGYEQVSKSTAPQEISTGANGDITITNITIVHWKKIVQLPESTMTTNNNQEPIQAVPLLPNQEIPQSAQIVQPTATSITQAKPVSSAVIQAPRQVTVSPKKQTPKKKATAQTSQKASSAAKTPESKAIVQSSQVPKTVNPKHPPMTTQQKVIQVVKVETAGTGGAVVGMGIAGGIWLLIQRLLPTGWFAFIIGKRRKKKDEDDKNA